MKKNDEPEKITVQKLINSSVLHGDETGIFLIIFYIPSLEQEIKRSATRLRESIVKMRQQVGIKIKSLLLAK